MTEDPFTITYDALWDMVEDSQPLMDLLRPGNLVKLSDRQPIKDRLADADVPELLLVPTGASPLLRRNSSSAQCTRTYSWIITTGDMRVRNRLFPVEWALFSAMTSYCLVLNQLVWDNTRFVENCQLLTATDGETVQENNRGLKGWSAVWTCQVQMVFNLAQLQGFNNGD